jgi:hypothetical protein
MRVFRLRSLLVVVLLWALPFVGVWAQGRQPLELGVRALPQLTWLVNQTDQDSDFFEIQPHFGYSAGLSFGQQLGKWTAFEMQVLYSAFGQRADLSVLDTAGVAVGTIPQALDFTYLSVPFMFHVRPQSEGRLRFSGLLGLQTHVLMGVTASLDGREIPIEEQGTIPILERFAKGGLSLVSAAGLELELSDRLRLSAHVRNDFSLLDVEDRTFKLPGRNPSRWSNTGLQLGLTCLIGKLSQAASSDPSGFPTLE